MERIELALATSPQALASVHMDHAERRAQEALALLDRDRLDSDLVTGALSEMAAAAAAVGTREPFRSQIEARTVQITALLDYAVGRAERSPRFPQEGGQPARGGARDLAGQRRFAPAADAHRDADLHAHCDAHCDARTTRSDAD
ncbi:MAG: hypothetical protein M5R40_08170 [Anaerolineae bacterium]|nr:hypothetical protein [Anaerolineae bacterium]